ncbi:MAG: polysulfide reductase NrfD [Chloroflexi bacterium]|nr:polysulfide reductase NrfD [Chloroflexota bacterium]
MLKRLLYVASTVAIVAGLWGLSERLMFGHESAAYGSYVVWGFWVAMYLFFVGIAAGAFIVATLDYVFNVALFKGTGRLALYLTLITLGAGLLHIWFDLGHLERIWKVYLQGSANSVMAQIVWGYTTFGLLSLIALILTFRPAQAKWLKVLMAIGIPLAIFLSGAVGALMGVQAARAFWHVGLFPVQFPFFALASGAAVMMGALGLFGDPKDARLPQQLWVLAVASIALQIIKLYFLWADFSQSLYGGVPQNVAAVNEVMFGQYWWGFWILQIGIGSLLPLIVLLLPGMARRPQMVGWIGVCLLIGFAVARANIVFPALTVPELDALISAFQDSRLQFAYFPSVMEWALSAGIIGLATAAFLVGYDRLPLAPRGSEA